jgi:hypothetical protein
MERDVSLKVGFSTKQQSAFGTGLADTDVNLAHPFIGNDIVERTIDKYDNKDEYGKGHEYPTTQKNLVSDTKASRNFEASSLILGWGFAFVCGQIATVQPDSSGAPNTYEHTMKLANIDDPTVGIQLPSTTLVEKLNSFQQKKFRDMVVSEISLSGKTKEQLKIGIQMVGSGHWETNAMNIPALSEVSFLRMADVVFNIGTKNISAELLDFEFTHKNNLAEDKGYHPGSGYLNSSDPSSPQIRGHLVTEKRETSLKLKVLMNDAELETYAENNIEKAISIVAEGSLIESTYKHKLELTFPKTFLKFTKVGVDGSLYIYDVEVSIAWDDAENSPFVAKVTNNIPEYLTVAT